MTREHGASVHFVTAELDGGPVVLQSRVSGSAGDTEATLARRVHATEHIIYPRVIDWFARGRLTWQDEAAWLDGRVWMHRSWRSSVPLRRREPTRARCVRALWGALLAALLSAAARRRPPTSCSPFEATYGWYWHGMNVAVPPCNWRSTGDNWIYSSNSEPRGIGKLMSQRPKT